MRTILLVILLVALPPARGGEVDVSGSVELQARVFWHDPAWVGQDDQALDSYRRALHYDPVNPRLRQAVEQLERALGGAEGGAVR